MGDAGGCSGASLGFGALGAGTVRILVGALVTFVLVIVVSLVGFWQTGCPKGGFQCNDGKCLPRSRWCNRVADCAEREDELEEECLLRQRTRHRDATFPNLTITSCDLCVCPHSSVEECLLPHGFNRRIVQCNVSSRGDYPNLPSQLPRRKVRSSDSYDMAKKVNRLIKAQEAELKRREDHVDRSEKHSRVNCEGNDGKFGIVKGADQQFISIPEKANCIHSNKSHGLEMKVFWRGHLDKLQLQEEQHSHNLPFFRQHRCLVMRDCKKGKQTENASSLLDYFAFPVRNQKFKTQQLITNYDSHSSDVPLVEGLLLRTQSASSPKNKKRNDPYTMTEGKSIKHKREKRHLRTHTVEGIPAASHIQDKIDTKQSHQEQSHLQDSVNRTVKEYDEDTRTPNHHNTTIGHHREDKDHKDVNPGYQGEGTHHEDMSFGHQTEDTNVLGVHDINVGGYAHWNGDYNHEEVTEQLENFCYCELNTHLKCPYTSLTHVPRHIVGDITLLNIKGSEIFGFDAGVMSQYPTLSSLSLEENLLVSLPHGVFANQSSLEKLYLSKNFIQEIHDKSCLGLMNLLRLFLDRNRLTYIDLTCFLHTPILEELNLAHNQLMLENQSFPHLPNLTNLYLNNNSLSTISEELLTNLTSVRTLELQDNRITVVASRAFRTLSNLQSLIMSGNLLTSVKDLFRGLHSLYLLNLEELKLHDINEEHFSFLSKLKIVYFDTFRYCSYVPKVPQCLPNFDGVSTSHNLVGWWVLRVGVWVVAGLTICGNILVIFCRAISRKDNKILKLFIKNLAAADLLMGVYLVIMGVQDLRTRGKFHSYALKWAASYTCTFAGILALVSSETSVFILTFMSLERYLYISETLDDRTLSERSARMCLVVIWLTSISLALFPTLWISSFYGSNAMCFPLHINEPFLVGWQYSAFIFLGLNIVSMVVIFGSYTGLFFNIRVTRLSTPLSSDEMNFALRFFFIVITNCFCWLPIMCVKVAALANIDIHQGVYAWLVVLVLPINSAVNPGLYTFSTSQFQSQVTNAVTLFRRVRHRQNSDTEALRHSSSRLWGSNIHNTHFSTTLHHHNHHHPTYVHPLPPVLAPLQPPSKPMSTKTASNLPPIMYQDHHKTDGPPPSSKDDLIESKMIKTYKNVCTMHQGVAEVYQPVVSEESKQSGNGNISYSEDICPQSQVTFSQVTQIRLRTQSYSDSQTSPKDCSQSSPVRTETVTSPTHPGLKTRSPRERQTFTDTQGFQDICLEAHVSRHSNTLHPSAFTSTFATTPTFQGNPLYVNCSASTPSEFQDSDILQLNLKVSYSPELIQTSSQEGPSGVNNLDFKMTSPEASAVSDGNKSLVGIPQVVVGTSTTLRRSPSPSQQLSSSPGHLTEEDS